MPIINTELKFFESTNLLGGAITANEVVDNQLHNVFPKATSDEALLGSTKYACIYVQNTNGSITLEDAIAYLISNTPELTTTIEFGIGSAAVGTTEQAIPDDETAPAGITFTELVGEVNAQAIGNIPSGDYKAIWFKRVIDAGTLAASADEFELAIDGDTGA